MIRFAQWFLNAWVNGSWLTHEGLWLVALLFLFFWSMVGIVAIAVVKSLFELLAVVILKLRYPRSS